MTFSFLYLNDINMTAILDLSSVKSRTHLLSLKEYYALGELGFLSKQTELIEGVILQKIPKSPKHATMVKKIFQFFMKTLPEGFHPISEQPITLSRSEPEPDISVVSGSIEDYSESHPTTAELVIEVTRRGQRDGKCLCRCTYS